VAVESTHASANDALTLAGNEKQFWLDGLLPLNI
jgi:hypothetical protein